MAEVDVPIVMWRSFAIAACLFGATSLAFLTEAMKPDNVFGWGSLLPGLAGEAAGFVFVVMLFLGIAGMWLLRPIRSRVESWVFAVPLAVVCAAFAWFGLANIDIPLGQGTLFVGLAGLAAVLAVMLLPYGGRAARR